MYTTLGVGGFVWPIGALPPSREGLWDRKIDRSDVKRIR